MKRIAPPFAMAIGIALAAFAAQAAELQVTGSSPARNTMAPANSVISVNFDRAVQTGSVNASSFRAFGRYSGTASGAFSFSNGDQTVVAGAVAKQDKAD